MNELCGDEPPEDTEADANGDPKASPKRKSTAAFGEKRVSNAQPRLSNVNKRVSNAKPRVSNLSKAPRVSALSNSINDVDLQNVSDEGERSTGLTYYIFVNHGKRFAEPDPQA